MLRCLQFWRSPSACLIELGAVGSRISHCAGHQTALSCALKMVGTMRIAAFRLFQPILAGATLRSRIVGCLGALLGIGLTAALSSAIAGGIHLIPIIVAPMGASAVLLFAVPSSPLSQPWPVIGGNVISTLVGITVAHFVPDPFLACGIAVALAILVMSLTRSLHPPGGAAALSAVIGGQAVASAGYMFALVPVGLNSALLVLAAIAFHRLTRSSYPHRPPPVPLNQHGTSDVPASARVGFSSDDVDAALASLDETFDIDRGDLTVLLQRIELQSLNRTLRSPTCADIMSRDVVTIGIDASTADAITALLEHNIRTLPVVDAAGRLAGNIGLRELAGREPTTVRELMTPATTVSPNQSAVELLPTLADGRHHVVVVVSSEGAIIGVVSQTDLLATIHRAQVA